MPTFPGGRETSFDKFPVGDGMQSVEAAQPNSSSIGRANPITASMNRECVVVISHDRLLSYALREILSESLGFKAVLELRRVSDIRLAIFASRPGLVIVTSGLLRDNPNGKLRGLRKKFGRHVRIAVLAAASDFWNDNACLVDATLDDRLDRDDVIEGLKAALQGEQVVKLLKQDHVATAEWERLTPLVGRLSPRTRQVLDLLVSGYSNNEIARLLGISEPTVKWNVSTMLAIFGLASRVRVVAIFARMRGLSVF